MKVSFFDVLSYTDGFFEKTADFLNYFIIPLITWSVRTLSLFFRNIKFTYENYFLLPKRLRYQSLGRKK